MRQIYGIYTNPMESRTFRKSIVAATGFFGMLAALSVGYAALSGGITASDKVSSNAPLSSASWNRVVDGILDLDARTNGISSMNGNIGIGVANPGKTLDIQGSLRISSGHIITNNPNGGIVLNAWPSDSSASGIWFRSTTQLWEEATYANLMRITGSGNVGIGTTVPGQKLSVAGTVESTSGGFKFPDGSIQTTAASGGIWNGTSVTIASATSIPTTTWTLVNWNAEEFDDQNLHDNSTNNSRITIANTGKYRVTASACFSSTDNGWYGVDVFKNGVSLSKGSIFISAGGTTYGATMQCANSSFSANFSSGDYLQVKAMVGVWSARNLLPGYSFFQVEQIK